MKIGWKKMEGGGSGEIFLKFPNWGGGWGGATSGAAFDLWPRGHWRDCKKQVKTKERRWPCCLCSCGFFGGFFACGYRRHSTAPFSRFGRDPDGILAGSWLGSWPTRWGLYPFEIFSGHKRDFWLLVNEALPVWLLPRILEGFFRDSFGMLLRFSGIVLLCAIVPLASRIRWIFRGSKRFLGFLGVLRGFKGF